MMTFLKKLGQILLTASGVAQVVGPIIQPFLGSGKTASTAATVTNDLTAISQTVVTVETAFAAIPGSTGAQKLQALVPLVANIISTSEVVSGKKIANDALFKQGCTEVAQGMVDVLNSIHEEAAQSSGKPVLPATTTAAPATSATGQATT